MAKVSLNPYKATESLTVKAIDAAIESDGGARFRQLLRKHMPLIEDAYRGSEDPLRSHLGVSQIGRPCVREIWYKWRWWAIPQFKPRMLRLFNRGHLEEARFLALLEMIGVHIHGIDQGGQERISAHGGHFGSALDGILFGVPECPDEWILGEFKTHNTKSFSKLVNGGGVAVAKPEHFAQMQGCMALRGIHKCLYLAVNKNDDDLHAEIVTYAPRAAETYVERAKTLILRNTPPDRLREDPSHFDCSYCDLREHCHYGKAPLRNCRTCKHATADLGGTWGCNRHGHVLDKQAQLVACTDYEVIS